MFGFNKPLYNFDIEEGIAKTPARWTKYLAKKHRIGRLRTISRKLNTDLGDELGTKLGTEVFGSLYEKDCRDSAEATGFGKTAFPSPPGVFSEFVTIVFVESVFTSASVEVNGTMSGQDNLTLRAHKS